MKGDLFFYITVLSIYSNTTTFQFYGQFDLKAAEKFVTPTIGGICKSRNDVAKVKGYLHHIWNFQRHIWRGTSVQFHFCEGCFALKSVIGEILDQRCGRPA